MAEKPFFKIVVDHYRATVTKRHPSLVAGWPIVSGYNFKVGTIGSSEVLIFNHTGVTAMITSGVVGDLSAIAGTNEITPKNIEAVRQRLERCFNLSLFDAVLFVINRELSNSELEALLLRHEKAMGVAKTKVFLSHKSQDKEMVKRFERVLRELGFDPWLDEISMVAGDERDRAVMKGFSDACAVVFFVTANFKDERFIQRELNHASDEKIKRSDFQIISLQFEGGKVPDLLTTYIWKEPKHELDGLYEIIRALPVRVGEVRFR